MIVSLGNAIWLMTAEKPTVNMRDARNAVFSYT